VAFSLKWVARPDYLSIGASYRALGWKVVAIEPNPDFCAAHRALGHDVLEYAVSDTEADDTNFFVVDSQGAIYNEGAVSFESFSSLGIKGQFADLHEAAKPGPRSKRSPSRFASSIQSFRHTNPICVSSTFSLSMLRVGNLM